MYFADTSESTHSGVAFTQQKPFEEFSMDNLLLLLLGFFFFAVTLGHQWNPFVTAVNQSRPQLLSSAKKQTRNLRACTEQEFDTQKIDRTRDKMIDAASL